MRVQTIKIVNKERYILIDSSFRIVEPVKSFLKFLDTTGKSQNTLKNYAHHLKLYFEFLENTNQIFNDIENNQTLIDKLSSFMNSLKVDDKVISITREQKRSNKTINIIMSTVINFYEYFAMVEKRDFSFLKKEIEGSSNFKGFLYEMIKNKEQIKTTIFHLKEKKTSIKTINRETFELMLEQVDTFRDKFLISLLFESGLRIGEGLGLFIEDIKVWDNTVILIERDNLKNNAKIKNGNTGVIEIPSYVMNYYTDYITEEFVDIDSDYVFVNLQGPTKGAPLQASTVTKLFERISKQINIKITPHMLRHSHATELIEKGGWDPIDVKDRLRHKNVQTTINTYIHTSEKFKKQKYKEFLEKVEGEGDDFN